MTRFVAFYLGMAAVCIAIIAGSNSGVLEVMAALAACCFSGAALLAWQWREIEELRSILRGERL